MDSHFAPAAKPPKDIQLKAVQDIYIIFIRVLQTVKNYWEEEFMVSRLWSYFK